MAAIPELLNTGDWLRVLSDVDTVLFDCDGDWLTHTRVWVNCHTVRFIHVASTVRCVRLRLTLLQVFCF